MESQEETQEQVEIQDHLEYHTPEVQDFGSIEDKTGSGLIWPFLDDPHTIRCWW